MKTYEERTQSVLEMVESKRRRHRAVVAGLSSAAVCVVVLVVSLALLLPGQDTAASPLVLRESDVSLENGGANKPDTHYEQANKYYDGVGQAEAPGDADSTGDSVNQVESIVYEMNVVLAENEQENGKPQNFDTAKEVLADDGYNVEQWDAFADGYDVYWDSMGNRMVLYSDTAKMIVYPPEYAGDSLPQYGDRLYLYGGER